MEIFHQYLDGHPELKAKDAPAVFKIYTLEMTEDERETAYAASLESYLESGKAHSMFNEAVTIEASDDTF
jgi:hypothetical protein